MDHQCMECKEYKGHISPTLCNHRILHSCPVLELLPNEKLVNQKLQLALLYKIKYNEIPYDYRNNNCILTLKCFAATDCRGRNPPFAFTDVKERATISPKTTANFESIFNLDC